MALAALSGMLLCACSAVPSGTSASESEDPAASSDAVSSVNSEMTLSSSAVTTESVPEETTQSSAPDETTASEETSSVEYDESLITDIGYGSYGFMLGSLRLHSKNDVSMLIQPEDATVYDFGVRDCSWIDAFYIQESFEMGVFDSSYRFLGFYNDDTSVNFEPGSKIGTWTTPKGSELDLCLTEITIISHNLEIKILPEHPSSADYYKVSVCGRGYYVLEMQLQMVDFFLSALEEEPGIDPLEGYVSSVEHTYYF